VAPPNGDLDAARAWYARAFQVASYFDEPFHVGFDIGGSELGPPPNGGPAAEKTTNLLACWGVEDIEGAVAQFIDQGATEDPPPTNVGGDIMVATIKDPWGTR
jgi:lactoylglutathione lyase